jgi:hypothetical protein
MIDDELIQALSEYKGKLKKINADMKKFSELDNEDLIKNEAFKQSLLELRGALEEMTEHFDRLGKNPN